MSRQPFAVEVGLKITNANSDTGVTILQGSAVPGGDGSYQDAAGIGSLYMRQNGQLYKKTANAGAAADWKEIIDTTVFKWRQERIRAATTQVAPASGATIDLSSAPLTGDETPFLAGANFTDDIDHILFGIGGTPKLMLVTNIAGDVITVTDILDGMSDGDMMFTRAYLPDTPGGQEGSAIIAYVGTAIEKISDINWNFADGITLNGSITDRNGPVLGSDTVQVALEKLEGDCKDQTTLNGVSRGAVNLGTFSGKAISDNTTIKQALQDLESALEARTQVATLTTVATLDQVDVDIVKMVKWLVHVFEEATPANVQTLEIIALHNGTAAADATTVDDAVSSKLKLGSVFNLTVSVDLNGTGASQKMRLRLASTSAGVTATARRIEVY